MGRRRKGDVSKGPKDHASKHDIISRSELSDPPVHVDSQTQLLSTITSGIVLAAIYIWTLHPSIPGGDSGELIMSAHEFGVAHPPGYPVFTITAKLAMTFLPFTSPAYSVNFLNAIYSALAGALIHLTTIRLTGCWAVSFVAVGIFSLSPLVWTWSVTAEVFGLNNLMVSALLLLAVMFDQAGEEEEQLKISYLGAFVCGLSLCNQHTIVIYVACIVLWVLWRLHREGSLSVPVLIKLSLCFLLGLTPYVYLPISSWLRVARWTWGDHRSLAGFIKHFLRQEYGTFDLGKDSEGLGFIHGANAYISHLTSGVGPAVPFFLIGGIVSVIKRANKKGVQAPLVFLLMFFVYALFFAWRANLNIANPLFRGVVERFWIQSDLVVSLVFALGLNEILEVLARKLDFMKAVNRGTALACSIAIIAIQIYRNYESCNQSTNYIVRDFASTLLNKMPHNSLILTKGDLPTNSMRYLHICENVRPDLTLLDQEVLTYQWSLPMLRHAYQKVNFPGDFWSKNSGKLVDGSTTFNFDRFLQSNIRSFSGIYACIGMQEHEDSWTKNFNVWPYGPCKKVMPVRSSIDPEGWAQETGPFADDWHYPHDAFDDRSWDKVANDEMWHAKIGSAFFLYQQGTQQADKSLQASLYMPAYKLYKSAIEKNRRRGFPFYWHKNFALACEKLLHVNAEIGGIDKMSLLKESIKHFTKYVEVASEDSDIDNILNAIKILKERQSMYEKLEEVDKIAERL